MRIALVSPYDFAVPGGVNKHIRALAREFAAQGHAVRILACASQPVPDDSGQLICLSRRVVKVDVAGSRAGISLSPFLYPRVKRLLLAEAFDVIHLHEPLAPALPLAVLRHANRLPDARIVATYHAYRDRPLAARPYGLVRSMLRRLDGHIAVSEAAKEFHSAYFPGEFQIIPNGVHFAAFSRSTVRATGWSDTAPTILFVGRLDERKGFHHLLAAFRQVKAASPTARLTVVGAFSPVDAAPFKRICADWRLAGVEFVGQVPEEVLPEYYRAADIFSSPATGFESFGLVLLEAMAAGCPVVASDIAGYQSVVGHEREGLLVPKGDVDALAQALVRLLQSPQERHALGSAGRVTASRHDWASVSRQVLDFYTDVLVHTRRRPAPSLDGGSTRGIERRALARLPLLAV